MIQMKSSDYIVDFLVNRGIKHCYGFQGTMIAHLVDSICADPRIRNHVCYNEQGAAYAAVGEAKISGKPSVAYATSGPGATNLLSGISDAYFDSAPVVFITGQLNTNEYLPIPGIRQHGFQEMDVVSVMKPVLKYAHMIQDPEEIRETLEAAFYWASEGRPGPVLVDIPMNMQRAGIDPQALKGFDPPKEAGEAQRETADEAVRSIIEELQRSERPVLMIGNGIRKDEREDILQLIEAMNIPVITSMLGRDIIPCDHPLNYGMIGSAYGHRYSNMIVNTKADLIIALGCSLCKRQTGVKFHEFAKGAKIIRVDIDPTELKREIKDDEIQIQMDCNILIPALTKSLAEESFDWGEWVGVCSAIRSKLNAFDATCEERLPNRIISEISKHTAEFKNISVDVGQHQVWAAQSYGLRGDQRMICSGGYGAMGFSLPAAIGASISTEDPTLVIAGDGAIQMNIQELQWVVREQLPITIVILNNRSLGLIQQQQDDIFKSRYSGSLDVGGYTVPDFYEVGKAYGLSSHKIDSEEGLAETFAQLDPRVPNLVEIQLPSSVRAFPKTNFGDPIHDQKPHMPRELMDELLHL